MSFLFVCLSMPLSHYNDKIYWDNILHEDLWDLHLSPRLYVVDIIGHFRSFEVKELTSPILNIENNFYTKIFFLHSYD